MKTLSEIKKEIDKFEGAEMTSAQKEAITQNRNEYQAERAELAQKYMLKELAIFKNQKLKLKI